MSSQDIRKILTLPLVESRTYGTNTYSYCVTLGEENDAWREWKAGYDFVMNDSSETEVRAVDSGKNVFTNVAAGDSIRFLGELMGNDRDRTVATRTDADNIVVNRAINLEVDRTDGAPNANFTQSYGYRFKYRTLSCGTAATDGWFPVRGWHAGNFLLIAESQAGAVGLDYSVEAYVEGAAQDPIILAQGSLLAAAIDTGGPAASVALGEFDFGTFGWTHFRVGVKTSAGTVTYSVYVTLKE